MNCTIDEMSHRRSQIDCREFATWFAKVGVKREMPMRVNIETRNVLIWKTVVVGRGGRNAVKIEINSQLRAEESFGNTDFPIDENTEIIYIIVSRSIVCVNYFQRGLH